MGRRKIELLGSKLGFITIIKDFKKNGQIKFVIKCDICGKEKEIWYSQYSTGSWSLCEHDAL